MARFLKIWVLPDSCVCTFPKIINNLQVVKFGYSYSISEAFDKVIIALYRHMLLPLFCIHGECCSGELLQISSQFPSLEPLLLSTSKTEGRRCTKQISPHLGLMWHTLPLGFHLLFMSSLTSQRPINGQPDDQYFSPWSLWFSNEQELTRSSLSFIDIPVCMCVGREGWFMTDTK